MAYKRGLGGAGLGVAVTRHLLCGPQTWAKKLITSLGPRARQLFNGVRFIDAAIDAAVWCLPNIYSRIYISICI